MTTVIYAKKNNTYKLCTVILDKHDKKQCKEASPGYKVWRNACFTHISSFSNLLIYSNWILLICSELLFGTIDKIVVKQAKKWYRT
jgi:hypothetical protein